MLRINEAINRILTLLTAAAVMVSVSGCYLLPDEDDEGNVEWTATL